jgi:DnaK suppressor protein
METSHFRELLLAEKNILEKDLSSIGRKNPDRKGDWEAVEPQDGIESEEGEVAENLAEFDDNVNNLAQLEVRLNEVNAALDRIESGIYGVCVVCENKIEEDRLEVNPAATTCKAHMG